MKQIGETAWVNPDHISAIEWDTYTERMPLVRLSNGGKVRADNYSIGSNSSLEERQIQIDNLRTDLFGFGQ